jgi:hypothetical protein
LGGFVLARPILAAQAVGLCGVLSAQIASSGALRRGRDAGSLADAGITGERFPGLRIERCCPAQTGVLLELDHLVDRLFDPKSPEKHQQPATTDSGASVEEQVRKEWNPKTDGDLPVF